ncbi:hypothetical protein ECZU28_25620 [Escherichia coli]|nr:hypothetical protein ECZU28_25620 [Escherichia coli]
MHADTATRQHWMSVLAHSQPAELAARLNALNITADYEVIRTAETGGADSGANGRYRRTLLPATPR